MNKGLFTLALLGVLLFNNLYAQSTSDSPHNGFNASVTIGSTFGNTIGSKGNLVFGNTIYRGSRMNVKMQLGYSYRNWAAGFSYCYNSMAVRSIEFNDTTHKLEEDMRLIDGSFGMYIKRYFMTENLYVCADFGIGSIQVYDAQGVIQVQTERGFSWSISAGKEFLIGKKKRFGIGGYFSLSGIHCRDITDYQKLTYFHVLPGLGTTFSFH